MATTLHFVEAMKMEIPVASPAAANSNRYWSALDDCCRRPVLAIVEPDGNCKRNGRSNRFRHRLHIDAEGFQKLDVMM